MATRKDEDYDNNPHGNNPDFEGRDDLSDFYELPDKNRDYHSYQYNYARDFDTSLVTSQVIEPARYTAISVPDQGVGCRYNDPTENSRRTLNPLGSGDKPRETSPGRVDAQLLSPVTVLSLDRPERNKTTTSNYPILSSSPTLDSPLLIIM